MALDADAVGCPAACREAERAADTGADAVARDGLADLDGLTEAAGEGWCTAAEADTDGVEGAVVAAGTPDWSSSWVHPVAVTAITATRAGKILRIIDMSLLNSGCGHNDIAVPHPMTVADGLVPPAGHHDHTARPSGGAPHPPGKRGPG